MASDLTGTINPPRYGAAIIDHVMALFTLVAFGGSIASRIQLDSEEARIALGLSVFGVYFLYYFIFEWLVGATPGKLITGLRVRKLDGSRCGGGSSGNFVASLLRV